MKLIGRNVYLQAVYNAYLDLGDGIMVYCSGKKNTYLEFRMQLNPKIEMKLPSIVLSMAV